MDRSFSVNNCVKKEIIDIKVGLFTCLNFFKSFNELDKTICVMFKNILVPYDGSEHSRKAFEYAVDMAKKYNSNVSIVTCISGGYRGHPYYDSREEEAILDLQKKAALKAISQLTKTKTDIQIRTVILESKSVAESLLSYAKSHKIDLIAMGSRGIGGFKKLILGSVASAVLQHSECPVLIAR